VLIIFTAPVIVLQQRNVVVVLTTTAGVRLVTIWKQKLNRWYIVGESENEGNLKSVIDKLTPRQFQVAVENGQYSFAW
jgi:hypothetical protein